jgi:3-dehydroquinate synthetase
VGVGLRFCLEWSFFKSAKKNSPLKSLALPHRLVSDRVYGTILKKLLKNKAVFYPLLLRDKKMTSGKIGFVFLDRIGVPVVEFVTKEDIYFELCRQVRLLSGSRT